MNKTLTRIGDLLATVSRERVCEGCGKSFSCGASLRGCWCNEIELTDEARTQLRNSYSDCLCRECLSSHAKLDSPAG
jgi:Cysteine-rich CWC